MSWNLHGNIANDGDLAELVGMNHKHFIIELKSGEELHTHRGILKHDNLIGQSWGSQVFSHNGSPFFLLQPALGDLLRELPRNSQILYPKEIGYILVSMGIGPGQQVIEAGTGSGALTTALAFSVGAQGHIFSYEVREQVQRLAWKNLSRVGLQDRVTLKQRDIAEGFDERNVDALFLDVPNPYDYIEKVREALKPGGFFGCILPTTNQIIKLMPVLRKYHFAFINILEIMLRFYKPESERFRPVDRMVAHTGFLVFARPVIFQRQLDESGEPVELQTFEDDNPS